MMPERCRRVVLVVLDGLRPDAIDTFELRALQALEASGASTRDAKTVRPSVTAAAMGSLLTGVAPEQHGLRTDRFHVPRPTLTLQPVPATLRAAGLLTSAFLARPPLLYRRLGHLLAARLGVEAAHFVDGDATRIAAATCATLSMQRSGFVLVHLPDGDRAGHAHGWMSPAYGQAARCMDDAVSAIAEQAFRDPPGSTVMMVCADHGGGGVVPDNHDSDHPLDRTIPIIMAGGGIAAGTQFGGASLLDVPATILSLLGVRRPACYAGRSLLELVMPFEHVA